MNGFLIYAGKRFLQFLFVVVTGITLAFLIAHFSPVDPVEQTVSLLTSFGSTDPQSVEILRPSLRELYGTGGPLLDQYFTFWGRVLTGDFGPSLSSFPTPVMTVIGRALPWT
ncbi:ABC transporter permease, partial [Bradyrhizobium sp. NBAIM20]|nr:ABC transporter permease [Bradyrhizobium sp. NBAIM20]